MTSTNYLEIELKNAFEKFKNIIIKYEFKPNRLSHIIEIQPLSVFESETFIDFEINLSDKFYEIYPQENLVFVSENSVTKIINPRLTLKNNTLGICFKNNQIVTEPIFNYLTQDFLAGDNNYALAA